MATPALVVGIGGTGASITCYVNHGLSQSHGGRMPPEVKLLHNDTDAGDGFEDHEVARVGGNLLGMAQGIAAAAPPPRQGGGKRQRT